MFAHFGIRIYTAPSLRINSFKLFNETVIDGLVESLSVRLVLPLHKQVSFLGHSEQLLPEQPIDAQVVQGAASPDSDQNIDHSLKKE